ncbi:MAG: mandelate racemase/muconate lactonizing enzyme family protein, partial [Rubrivivax sp.]
MTAQSPAPAHDHDAGSRITNVQARTVNVPLDHETSFSTRKVSARDYVLVSVRTADGHEGQGFCYGGSRAGVLVAHAVRELFQPLLLGQSALRTEGLWQEMYQDSLLH